MSIQAASADRRQILTGWFRIVFGLLIFAFGVHLTIYANIGLAPWDCLGMGIAKHTPLNYGLSIRNALSPVHRKAAHFTGFRDVLWSGRGLLKIWGLLRTDHISVSKR